MTRYAVRWFEYDRVKEMGVFRSRNVETYEDALLLKDNLEQSGVAEVTIEDVTDEPQ